MWSLTEWEEQLWFVHNHTDSYLDFNLHIVQYYSHTHENFVKYAWQ